MKIKNTGLLSLAAVLTVMSIGANAKQTEGQLVWPDMTSSYQSEGDFIQPDAVRRVKAQAVTKDETRLLLGNPHFTEGYFGVKEWNYIFNFYTGKGSNPSYITCQYQVHFDDNAKVDRTSWKDEQCAKLVAGETVAEAKSEPKSDIKNAITLEADGMFGFGKSSFSDLHPAGRAKLENLARQILTGYVSVKSIDVAGHTDRLGSAQSNYALSLARANAVKGFLVSRGIPENVIRTQGLGAESPVVSCVGSKSARTVDCLSPNRRVTVSVNGEPK